MSGATRIRENDSPLRALARFGQSVWMDYLRRDLIASGELERRIAEDGLRGVTSNPVSLANAVLDSGDYREQIRSLRSAGVTQAADLYDRVVGQDIRGAADVLRSVYDATGGADGYVSLEVPPRLARDTRASIEEARRLWNLVDRPNLMIKIPGTLEGVPAVRQLISEGINVNITLLFDIEAYNRVARAYMEGLEECAAAGGDVRRPASVASFFVSRIDTAIDPLLGDRPGGEQWMGRAAIANAKLAYQHYLATIETPRWKRLEGRGARRQRLLWASTSTKNPRYRDVLYIEELIGPDTVNTMTPASMQAFEGHGRPRASLTEDIGGARELVKRLSGLGISLEEVAERLVTDGLRQFSDADDKLLGALGQP